MPLNLSLRLVAAAIIVFTLIYFVSTDPFASDSVLEKPATHDRSGSLSSAGGTASDQSNLITAPFTPAKTIAQAASRSIQNKRAACTVEYVSAIQKAVKAEKPPQLAFDQIVWISSVVQTSAYATLQLGREHQFLVWGLGYDSALWENANCIPVQASSERRLRARQAPSHVSTAIGRTAFLENWESWISQVTETMPHLEVHHFADFKSSVAAADEYFENPTLLILPEVVEESCWDVVLVDAPQGYEDQQPGRMEATYWAVNMAKRCLRDGHLKSVYIFLHDVNRPVEEKIVERILKVEDGTFLGRMTGPFGDLVGVRFHKL
ncbi:hypothetical protein DFS34DRAFT_649981 [Phlyctochytrium arcticum]|nr:hypothetical protein DFS34DRAFT_649981 [Phlyctochytrium arcticum]